MPRARRPRTIGAEDGLAERVRAEMIRQDWSYAMLATAMGRAGVDISASSLQKSFAPGKTPEQRRPIRVDELVAIARVLATTVENLLSPRDWIDQEQVDKALADMDRADRLLAEAVQTMLDAQVTLVKATAGTPEEAVSQVAGDNTTYWWGTSSHLSIQPRDATKTSTPISTQAIGKRLAQLKAVIHAMAVHWCHAEQFNQPAWKTRGHPVIGTTAWDLQLTAEITYYNDPDPDDLIPPDDLEEDAAG